MLIVNPYSGRGLLNSTLGGMIRQFCTEGYAVTVFTTEHASAKSLAQSYGGAFDLVICAGGDGTLSDVFSGLMRTGNAPPVGYIPTGTANDMARTLALSKDTTVSVRSIINGKPTPIDIGQFDDDYFTYIAAFGAFTGVSYNTTQSAKRALGHLAYILAGIASMPAIKPQRTRIEYDGGVIEDEFIFGGVTNTTSVAGMVKLDPRDVQLGDGRFEVLLVKYPLGLADLGEILTSIANKTYRSDNVMLLHTKKVRFSFDEEVAWTRDGEDGGMHRELEIINHREAMRIIL